LIEGDVQMRESAKVAIFLGARQTDLQASRDYYPLLSKLLGKA
jgi:hypothetical protein